ncbi:MAG: hypothetical protein V4690_03235 [Patescibacteria group bacterium]
MKTIAFISLNPIISCELTSSVGLEESVLLRELVSNLSIGFPRIRHDALENDELFSNLDPVSTNSENYMLGVLEELKIVGFIAHIVPVVIKPILMQISLKLTEQQRNGIVGEVVNLPVDIEEETLVELQQIIEDLSKLRD